MKARRRIHVLAAVVLTGLTVVMLLKVDYHRAYQAISGIK